ncbi:LPD16 domain-containing protein [Actinosynnema sp. NPDC047251]|uniref:Large polyvalent protein-associated domain-containing protein n=1 Tax=Saccharothrix espanaensis (strain ATCC 51144 / DSM 44229 / JCM 9112 / NBRC 15066 / NRRL 15764) TaxID=1179773 RepID=K0JVC1_SACES|nr:LPD16 domain-containing protein [Saccharothrix espanaensis]CCH31815.1 hypothetical protein BN6_45350 [Saccharothrix espanaensis DSM 44229]
MMKKHTIIASEEELHEFVRDELAERVSDDLVIMGGHYMLFADEDSDALVPGIIEEQASETMRTRIERRVGIFPGYTWDLAVELAEKHAGQFADTRLLLLVNDWQYVPTRGRSASELRAEHFAGMDALPARFRETLARSSVLSEANVLASRKHPLVFPETWLKYRFQKSADKLVKQGRLEKRLLETGRAGDAEVSFLDADGNYRTLISCGVTGCAGEITEMISEVHRAGHRTLLIFAPGECFAPVRTGVEIALELYGLTGMHVLVADPGGSGEMSVAEIYGKTVNAVSFRS